MKNKIPVFRKFGISVQRQPANGSNLYLLLELFNKGHERVVYTNTSERSFLLYLVGYLETVNETSQAIIETEYRID